MTDEQTPEATESETPSFPTLDIPIVLDHSMFAKTPTNHRILYRIEDIVEKILEGRAMGERTYSAVSMTMVPTTEGMAPALMILVAVDSPVLGQHIQVPMLTSNLFIEEAEIERFVHQSFDQMLEVRSQMLAQQSGVTFPGSE